MASPGEFSPFPPFLIAPSSDMSQTNAVWSPLAVNSRLPSGVNVR